MSSTPSSDQRPFKLIKVDTSQNMITRVAVETRQGTSEKGGNNR